MLLIGEQLLMSTPKRCVETAVYVSAALMAILVNGLNVPLCPRLIAYRLLFCSISKRLEKSTQGSSSACGSGAMVMIVRLDWLNGTRLITLSDKISHI